VACTIAAPSKLHVVIAPSGPGALTIGSVLNRPRRSGTDWWSAAATASEERGYTGHEHLDDVTLIHMNGRAYDPQLARFTSPDRSCRRRCTRRATTGTPTFMAIR
jgi:RHS repeat-associated protein